MSTIFNISDKIKLTNNPFPLLLNTYSGAAAAYSLRQLDYNYTDAAVRVRRDSDNTEQDINFVNGELDTATLESFVNNGNVLTNPDITSAAVWTIGNSTTYNASTEAFDLVNETGLTVRQSKSIANHTYTITIVIDNVTSGGIKVYAGGTQSALYSTAGTHTFDITAGTSNTILGINPAAASLSISSFYAVDTTADAFVTTWYDQSGNGLDVTQSTAADQPQIVSSGSTITEGTKPSINFYGSQYFSYGSIAFGNNANIVAVVNSDAGSPTGIFAVSGDNSASEGIHIWNFQNKYTSFNSLGSNILQDTNVATSKFAVIQAGRNTSSESYMRINSVDFSTTPSVQDTDSHSYLIGSITTTQYGFDGRMSEFIVYNQNMYSDLANIETNINDFYSIY
jgi:hypothetical protein